jgi:hypothetical protein
VSLNNHAFLLCEASHKRKNWLFSWTELGARQIGIAQSLLVTCKLHDIDPYELSNAFESICSINPILVALS